MEKEQNSKFEVLFLLNLYCFHTTVKLKNKSPLAVKKSKSQKIVTSTTISPELSVLCFLGYADRELYHLQIINFPIFIYN